VVLGATVEDRHAGPVASMARTRYDEPCWVFTVSRTPAATR
jgi:hypothetical protein